MLRKIQVDGVEITLTQKQEEEIKEGNKYKVESINSLQDAEEILKQCKNHKQEFEKDFKRPKDWVSYQIETIIKAVNFLDNNKEEWIPDFDDKNERKHFPYFEKKKSGWVLYCVFCRYDYADLGSGFYFMKESTAELIAKKHIDLYNKYLPK